MDRDSSVGIATPYGLDGPGIKSWWGARFSAPVLTGPGAHPASYTVGTGSLLGVKRPERGVHHPPHLVPRLKKEYSWIKRDQLDVTCFIISLFNAQRVLGVNVVSGWSRLKQCFSLLHPDTTPPQPNHNVKPAHIEPKQYNTWNNSTNKSQGPEGGCANIRNMLSIK